MIKLEASYNATEKESHCSTFRLNPLNVEGPNDSEREFHNLAVKYEKGCRP